MKREAILNGARFLRGKYGLTDKEAEHFALHAEREAIVSALDLYCSVNGIGVLSPLARGYLTELLKK